MPNVFYTKADAEGAGTGGAVVITPMFTIDGDGTMVEFAPGNLWYNTSEEKFYFEANQWDYRHYSRISSDGAVIGGVSGTIPDGTVGSFFWSKTESVAYAQSYSDDGASTSDVFFTNDTETTANPNFTVNGETGTWRTLSRAEWNYLLNIRGNELRAWKNFGNDAIGLVILPDGTDASVMESITSTADLATYGAVFLPAAGQRGGEMINDVKSNGSYWSSTLYDVEKAYHMNSYLQNTTTKTSVDRARRELAFPVRLVR